MTDISVFAYYEIMMDFRGAKHQSKKLYLLLAGAAILVILLVLLAAFLFWQINASKKDSDEARSERIISQVDDLFMLPQGEAPTVAEVQDLSKLKGQDFFANAKNGDFLLVYSKAKVAFLYRESEDKLVNVGPIKTENNAANQTSATE